MPPFQGSGRTHLHGPGLRALPWATLSRPFGAPEGKETIAGPPPRALPWAPLARPFGAPTQLAFDGFSKPKQRSVVSPRHAEPDIVDAVRRLVPAATRGAGVPRTAFERTATDDAANILLTSSISLLSFSP